MAIFLYMFYLQNNCGFTLHYWIVYSVFVYFIFSLNKLRLKRNIFEPNLTSGLTSGKQRQQSN